MRAYRETGMDGLLVSPLGVGDDPAAKRDRVFRLAAAL